MKRTLLRHPITLALAALLAAVWTTHPGAQDRLKAMPGYDQYVKMQPQLQGTVVSGAVNVTWAGDGKSFTYNTGGKAYQFDLATMQAVVTGDAPVAAAGAGRGAGGRGVPPVAVAGQTPPAGQR